MFSPRDCNSFSGLYSSCLICMAPALTLAVSRIQISYGAVRTLRSVGMEYLQTHIFEFPEKSKLARLIGKGAGEKSALNSYSSAKKTEGISPTLVLQPLIPLLPLVR